VVWNTVEVGVQTVNLEHGSVHGVPMHQIAAHQKSAIDIKEIGVGFKHGKLIVHFGQNRYPASMVRTLMIPGLKNRGRDELPESCGGFAEIQLSYRKLLIEKLQGQIGQY
jgi:hypothetical protein